ncbi:MAG: ATP-binding cassette domain-containing protein [Pseudomonadales bacterium]|nr:ATP-binding cassette domain-containing protein [Pseudomonadales bacterium]
MIKLDQVSKQFGPFRAVDNLSFSVSAGEVLGFLGPNGAGKTTTMKIITGFLAPTSGSIELFGQSLPKDGLKAKEMIGYLPEGAPAWGDMSVCGFLRFIAELRGYKGAQRDERVAQVVESLELTQVFERTIETLSKGFKRRVGLAQALIHDPKILILDEPTDGLDPNQKFKVRELIRNLSKDKIVIISTHILEEVNALCSRVIMIADGKLVSDATPAELEAQSDYHQAVTVRFSSAIDPQQKLQQLSNVTRIEAADGCFTLLSTPGNSVLEDVKQLAEQENWDIAELYIEKGRLDDVFRKLTT